MTWSKKHIIQKITFGSRYENGKTVTYTLIEKRYIPVTHLRKLTDGTRMLKQHDYKLRGRRSRTSKIFITKYDI